MDGTISSLTNHGFASITFGLRSNILKFYEQLVVIDREGMQILLSSMIQPSVTLWSDDFRAHSSLTFG